MTEPEPILPEDPGIEEESGSKPAEKPGLAFFGALALVAVLVILVFFANVQGTRASAGIEITKPVWTLQSYAGAAGSLIPILPGSNVTARFGPYGRLSGNAGCNQYVAHYAVTDYGITVTSLVKTEIFCESPGVMQQEDAYVNELENASNIRFGKNSMNLYDTAGKLLMVFGSV